LSVVALLSALPCPASPKEATVDKSITQLGQDLALAKYAKATRESYVRTAEHLSGRFKRPLTDLTREELRTYVEELTSRGKSASWLTMHLAALLFLYRKTLGQPERVSFVSFPKQPRPLPTVLSLEEVGALLRALHKPVYQAIAMVLYGAGLRIAEALALEVTDIDGARGVIRVRHGKGNKPREAKLSPSLYQWLRQYWSRERPPLPYLFASRRTGKPPVAESVRSALALAAKEAWVKKHVTPHVLRHSFTTHLLEQGTDVRVVSALLGHASLLSTARYGRVTEKLVRETPSPLDLLPHRRW
jgi:site-specific recombinase XerD